MLGRIICSCFFLSLITALVALERLGGKPLAAACAASGENLAAAGSSHACTETVTTLADEIGWLESALHLFTTAVCGPSWFCLFIEYDFAENRFSLFGIMLY